MNKDFEKYVGKRVWCKSEYFAEAFLRLAHDNGWEWINGESLLDRTYWEVYEKYTCYYVGEDKEIFCNTIRQHKPYYLNEFIEYEPLCADKDVSQEKLKGENKMNNEERVKLVFETISKIVGFEIIPNKDFYIVANGDKVTYRIDEELNLVYKSDDGSYDVSVFSILPILKGGYQLEEIKEPLLTEEEENFLRQFRFEELQITHYLYIYMYGKGNIVITTLSLNTINLTFIKLIRNKRYSRTELGL